MDLLTRIMKWMRETVRTEVRMLVRDTGYAKEAHTQSAATKHLTKSLQATLANSWTETLTLGRAGGGALDQLLLFIVVWILNPSQYPAGCFTYPLNPVLSLSLLCTSRRMLMLALL